MMWQCKIVTWVNSVYSLVIMWMDLEQIVDFYGPVPTREHILEVVDEHSRCPEVEILWSTSAAVVIPKLDRILSMHGIAKVIKTDNSPPLMGLNSRLIQ